MTARCYWAVTRLRTTFLPSICRENVTKDVIKIATIRRPAIVAQSAWSRIRVAVLTMLKRNDHPNRGQQLSLENQAKER